MGKAKGFRGDQGLLVIPMLEVQVLTQPSDQELELGCKVGIDATKTLSKTKEKFEKEIRFQRVQSSKILKQYQSNLNTPLIFNKSEILLLNIRR